jgi:xanthine dehydrogenase iron-sulfur cluster and FAD-binding subunit A
MRASSNYRLRTAGALLKRFYLQSHGGIALRYQNGCIALAEPLAHERR